MQARPWLPPSEGADLLLERGISRTLVAWADRWLPEPEAVKPLEIAVEIQLGRRGPKPGCELSTTPQLCLRIGELVTGVIADPALPADTEVIERVGQAAIEDLRAAFAISLPRAESDTSSLRVAVSSPVLPALTFLLDGGLISSLREVGVLPSSQAPRLGTLADALVSEPIGLRCALGEAEIHAGDVVDLVPGDLLVLDRKAVDAVPMVAAPGSPALGACHLAADGDAIILKIAGSPAGAPPAGGA